ncbi:MAG TPA: FAD-binding oxidoreductase [Actinomycetota bacterium]|nr:FAD-binding oxidoreductase [Actinomycetota bacterium]
MSLDELASLLPGGTISTDDADLAAHARDWWPGALLRERSGEAPVRPAAVVRPSSAQEVASVLAWADRTRTPVVPFGGGSGVCGAAQAVEGALALDTRRLDSIEIDDETLMVTAGAGVMGHALEDALSRRGLTAGHFPQSIDISTVGGWCATRGAGQKSGGYGRIDDMVLGLEVALPGGRLVRFASHPGTSAGPDLKRMFLGSEGTLGVITEVTLAAYPQPASVAHETFAFVSFGDGLRALRRLARDGVLPAVARLYDETDAGIAFREDAPGGSVLIVRHEDSGAGGASRRESVNAIAGDAGGRALGPGLSEAWWTRRNHAVETFGKIMHEGLLGPTGAVDTMEIAGAWPADALYAAVCAALSSHADVVACHASHVYPQGVCLYFTFVLLGSADDTITRRRYDAAWSAGMEAAIAGGATITHHHGVGLLRAPWIERELGEAMSVWRAVKAALDPNGIMNPGKAGL